MHPCCVNSNESVTAEGDEASGGVSLASPRAVRNEISSLAGDGFPMTSSLSRGKVGSGS